MALQHHRHGAPLVNDRNLRLDPAAWKATPGRQSDGRAGQPEDIAGAALFLASGRLLRHRLHH
jgi:NAD(P)-dependent dehydrogenase (short-subunit alcohol dehydrogenase family)